MHAVFLACSQTLVSVSSALLANEGSGCALLPQTMWYQTVVLGSIHLCRSSGFLTKTLPYVYWVPKNSTSMRMHCLQCNKSVRHFRGSFAFSSKLWQTYPGDMLADSSLLSCSKLGCHLQPSRIVKQQVDLTSGRSGKVWCNELLG